MNAERSLLRSLMTTIGLSFFFLTVPANAETLKEYVSACKNQLGFDSIPKFSCKDIKFRSATNVPYLGLDFSQSDDFVAHRQINDSVDAVFACRWVAKNGAPDRAVSGEMIIHNRHNGGTCFFELKDRNEVAAYPQKNINPVSPEASNASVDWSEPAQVVTCTGCHTAGAYVASPEIVGALAKFGLINDGHDVWGGFYSAAGSSGSALAARLNTEIQQHVTQPVCASACHVMRGDPAIDSVVGAGLVFGAVVMPSINHIITEVSDKNAMPPNGVYSDYRWVNRDDPRYSGDYERLSDVKNEYPPFYCKTPSFMQARLIDDGTVYATNATNDVLNTFNVQEGLVCMNADQASGACNDYQTRYRCGDGSWGDWEQHDRPNASGDFERRSSYTSCGSKGEPTAIQAKYVSGGRMYVIDGPPDRLYQFDRYGLVCRNQDQPSGERCHNYAVRFICN